MGTSDELCILVDSHDNILGYKPREHLTHGDRHRSTAIWLENSRGEVLLAQRHAHKQPHPGLWGPAVTGTVNHHETFFQNAYRELQEELGLKPMLLTEILRQSVDHPDGSKRFTVWFKGQTDLPLQDFRLQPEEVAGVRWVSKPWLQEDLLNNPQKYMPSARFWPELFLG